MGTSGVLDCAIFKIFLMQTCKIMWCHKEDGICSHLYANTALDTDILHKIQFYQVATEAPSLSLVLYLSILIYKLLCD